jgi:hypothetical protein
MRNVFFLNYQAEFNVHSEMNGTASPANEAAGAPATPAASSTPTSISSSPSAPVSTPNSLAPDAATSPAAAALAALEEDYLSLERQLEVKLILKCILLIPC